MIFELALVLALVQPSDSGATAKELEAIEQQLAATWKTGDCAGWGALLAPEWSVIHINATVITKAEAVEMCKAPRPPLEMHKVDELTFRIYADSAVVTGRTTVRTGGASPTTISLRFTDVLVR